MGAARLIHSVIQTERTFKEADRTTTNKIHVVQTLTLMSRMGITTLLATAGGAGGTALGSIIPGVGNLVGGIGGTLTGAGVGMYLNRHLQPHMLNLALDIVGMEEDDLSTSKTNRGLTRSGSRCGGPRCRRGPIEGQQREDGLG